LVRISDVSVADADHLRIEYLSTNGVYYVLEGAQDVEGPYSVVGMELGTGGTNTLRARALGGEAGFYRLREMPLTSTEDHDGDGLPDAYELQNPSAFNPLDPSDAAGDADGDGIPNLEEFRQGWDPLSGESPTLAVRSRLPGGPTLVSVRFTTGIAASSLGGGVIETNEPSARLQGPRRHDGAAAQIPNLIRIRPEVSVNDHGVMAFIAETRRDGGGTNLNLYVTRQNEDQSWTTEPVMTTAQSVDTYELGPGLSINNGGWIAVRRATRDRILGMDIVTSYADLWNGNVFEGQNRGSRFTVAVGAAFGSEFTTIRSQVAFNNVGTMAFFAQSGATRYIALDGASGAFKNVIGPAVVDTPLSLSDADTIVLRLGDASGRIVLLSEPNFLAQPVVELANPSLGFVSLGRAPGVSDDGRIITFYADYVGPTNAVLDAQGPGEMS
jgi:hypothetical protein